MKQHKKGKDQKNLIAEFKTDLKIRHKSNYTVTLYPQYVRAFNRFVGGNLSGVDEKTLILYLEHLQERKLNQTTIMRYFAGLSSYYEFLIWNGYATRNPVKPVQKRYLTEFKPHDTAQRRQCITIAQAKTLVTSILDLKERAVVVLLLKTGMRRHELSELDLKSIDMENMTIHIKPTAKRSNELVYFDKETAFVVGKWLKIREKENKNKIDALFINRFGNRLSLMAINKIVEKHAIAVGLHDPNSKDLQDRFSCHSCRHYFTNTLVEAVMPRELIKELRGDVGHDAIDIYTHIDRAKLKRAYLDLVPQLDLL
jgi:integrase/recombinase XerD